jgi:hypothetical protein
MEPHKSKSAVVDVVGIIVLGVVVAAVLLADVNAIAAIAVAAAAVGSPPTVVVVVSPRGVS